MNEIKHYVLPEHTNTLYKEEARSSIALTKEVADKINELVDAYNQFSKIDLEWKHEQEGKIRGGILYMKDNLINTLNDLLAILESRGFFETNVKTYTQKLEAQLNNLLSSVSTDGEVIDIRVGADGKVYSTAGESVRTQVENIIDEISSMYSKLFAKELNLTEQGYVAYGNVLNNTDQAKRTGKISCKDYEYVKYNSHLSNAGYVIALYTAGGVLIEEYSKLGASAESVSGIINLKEAGAYYIEASCYGEAYYNDFHCILYNENYIEAQIPKSFSDIISKDYSLSLDGYVALGNVINANANAKRTGRISCKNYRYVKYSAYLTSAGYELALYNAKGEFIEEYSILGSGRFVKDKVVDLTDTGAEYLEVSCYGITNSKNAYCTLYNSDNKEIPTKHKQFLIFGDSITVTASISADGTYIEDADTSWVTYAKDIMQIGSYKNYAKSGARYRDFSGEYLQKLSEQVDLAINDATNNNTDVIVLSLGTNDLDITDSTDTYENAMKVSSVTALDRTKFYQAVRYAMWKLKTKYPTASCFVTTPIQRASREVYTKIYNAIVEMGKRYNFIVIDAYAESGIIRENEVSNGEGVYLKDGLHPNDNGDILLANYYSKVIMNNLNR